MPENGSMDEQSFEQLINGTDNFSLRRAVERLREGLFDPLGVQWLTSGEEKLNRLFDKGASAVEKGTPSHLCICGAYGQGKSHSLTYLKQRALNNNFVVSYINLDPRQIPFHNPGEVYRALMAAMTFPNGENSFDKVWKNGAAQWLDHPENRDKTLQDLIPGQMPHRFRAILAAMALKNMVIPPHKRKLKKHARFKPREFPWILKNALLGKDMPVWRLRAVFHYRQVPFYKDHSLVCRDPEQYLTMITGLAQLFRTMGFKGWMVLFDEGESIGQTRITSRSRSYELLHRIFCPETSQAGFYPVFAFTHDFFTLVSDEPYDRTRTVKKTVNNHQPPMETSLFFRNYHKAWKDIHIYSLQELSTAEWQKLIQKLLILHSRAYGWEPDSTTLSREMEQLLSRHGRAESRMKLRLLVNCLDLEQQKTAG